MTFGEYQFRDLDAVIDGVHALFEQWQQEIGPHPVLDEIALEQTKLAVHEWIANLVQHAEFGDREPEISLAVVPNGCAFECAIKDNSEGFDLHEHLLGKSIEEAFPERGMGLLIMQACTNNLRYSRLEGGGHHLEFIVSAGSDPWVNIPF